MLDRWGKSRATLRPKLGGGERGADLRHAIQQRSAAVNGLTPATVIALLVFWAFAGGMNESNQVDIALAKASATRFGVAVNR